MTVRVAMIGQRGLPATFGGIERHVEEIGRRLVDRGHEVSVFCRPNYAEATRELTRPDFRLTNRGNGKPLGPSVTTLWAGAAALCAAARGE